MKTIKINFDSRKNELLGISDYLAVHFLFTTQIFTALRSNGSDHHDPTEHKSDHGRRSRKCLYDRFTGGGRTTAVWTAEY